MILHSTISSAFITFTSTDISATFIEFSQLTSQRISYFIPLTAFNSYCSSNNSAEISSVFSHYISKTAFSQYMLINISSAFVSTDISTAFTSNSLNDDVFFRLYRTCKLAFELHPSLFLQVIFLLSVSTLQGLWGLLILFAIHISFTTAANISYDSAYSSDFVFQFILCTELAQLSFRTATLT